jgi:hypothetical protein
MQYTRLGELLSGSFNDILRTAGIQIGMDKLNALREQCERLGVHLEKVIHNKSIEVAKKLQQATSGGFEAFEKDLSALEKRIEVLEKKKAPKKKS